VLHMRYTYDNSADNPRNPNHPPKRVEYGPQSTDEMAELWLQLLTKNPLDLKVLSEAYEKKQAKMLTEYSEEFARRHPDDAKGHIELGEIRIMQRRNTEAEQEFEKAARLKPDLDDAHYFLGLMARIRGDLTVAEREFKNAIRLNPDYQKAYGNLGLIEAEQGKLKEAKETLQRALTLNPDDAIAREALKELREAQR